MITNGIYRHFKGALYKVLLVADHEEIDASMVVYHQYPFEYEKDERGLPRSIFTIPGWKTLSAPIFEEDVEWPDGVRRPRFVRIDATPLGQDCSDE